jgi:hypothetical protein
MSRDAIYFFCRPDASAYQNEVVILAEGLRELGVPVFANCDYWRPAPDASFLLRHDPAVRPEDCAAVVVSNAAVRWMDHDFSIRESPLPACALVPASRRSYRTVFLDVEDGYETISLRPEYRAFDHVLRTHHNRRCFHPGNHRPWVLGYSRRVMDATAARLPWSERSADLLVNFYASHSYVHPARILMEKKFVPLADRLYVINRERDRLDREPESPYDALMWRQTQRRHCQAYYDRLGRARAVAGFCGELIPAAPHRPRYLVGGRRARISRGFFNALDRIDPRATRIIQWDSWRFWESLCAGCLAFNFDLPHYGVQLPVMPENFVHYVGVRHDNVPEVLTRLEADPSLSERIAAQGRVWALEHYSPLAMARRFLGLLA